jgi:hypothetical protein
MAATVAASRERQNESLLANAVLSPASSIDRAISAYVVADFYNPSAPELGQMMR